MKSDSVNIIFSSVYLLNQNVKDNHIYNFATDTNTVLVRSRMSQTFHPMRRNSLKLQQDILPDGIEVK